MAVVDVEDSRELVDSAQVDWLDLRVGSRWPLGAVLHPLKELSQ